MIKGLHHVSMKCDAPEDFARARAFYCGVLGLAVAREWAEGMLLDTGAGMIEVFCNGAGERRKGAIRHFALAVDDVDACAARVAEAGYEVFLAPHEICFDSCPPYRALAAFCIGPLGEEIELFMERED